MTLSNPIFSNSGAASFLDARSDMAGLIVQDETGLTRPGVLWASQDQLVTGRNDLMVDVHDFNASLERHGALLIANRGTAQVAVAAAPAANSRIDVVYVMQRETQAPMSDAGPAGPVFGVVQGVAAAVPVVPTSLPEGALALATIRMPAGASTTNSSGVVISQTYPMTTCNGGVIPMRSATDLDAFAGVEHQRARLADGTEYVRQSGVWVSQTQLPSLLGRGQWYGDYSYRMSGGIVGRTCLLSVYITRTAADWTGAKAWDRAAILTIPPSIAPLVNDMNIPAAGVMNWGFQLTAGGIAVRPFVDGTLARGRWMSAVISWQF